ncbi:MAG: hypothetical protein QG597_5212 [Actinomycetota bacterium]|nr:hypothetical protein [Actinomycetota bacterium]
MSLSHFVRRSVILDGMIGEQPQFHQTFAYYGQGVSIGTAVLGPRWQSRLVRFDDSASAPAQARCLDPHGPVLAKLAASTGSVMVEAGRVIASTGISSTRWGDRAGRCALWTATGARPRNRRNLRV